MRWAFTLIELLVVIAIIAVLAAILFPVFAGAKLAAQKSRTMVQMRQLSIAVFLYAQDYDDHFVPASARPESGVGDPEIWPPKVLTYAKNKAIFVLNGTDGTFAEDWGTRRNQNIGYNDATGVDPFSTAVEGAAPPGTEGFKTAASFSQADDPSIIGLFALTPNSTTGKERGYVFNPYNGPDDPGGDYFKGLPLIADTNLCLDTPLSPGQLKPIFARLGANGKGDGMTPIIFADSHCRAYTAKSLNTFGKVVWRFR